MRLVIGLSALALGTVVAAGYLYNGQPEKLAQVPIVTIDDIGAESVRTFSPEAAPFAEVATGIATAEAVTGPPAGAVQDQATWRTAAAENKEKEFDDRLTSMQPGDEDARRQLVRNLQTEMRRVGCYSGDISGDWSAQSQAAMGELLAHANAVLPINEPDYILLKMAQGQKPGICASMPVPTVVPAAVVAEQPPPPPTGEHGPASGPAVGQTASPADAEQDLPPGRMAVGGPQAEAAAEAEPKPVVAIETPRPPLKPIRRFKTRSVSELFQHPLGH